MVFTSEYGTDTLELAAEIEQRLISRGLAAHETPLLYHLLSPAWDGVRSEVFRGTRRPDGSLKSRATEREELLVASGVDPMDGDWASANWLPYMGWQICGTSRELMRQLAEKTSGLKRI